MKNFTEKLQYYMSLNYPSQITKIDEADGDGFLIEVPMLKGCMSDGETVEEAYNNLEEAKKEWHITILKKQKKNGLLTCWKIIWLFPNLLMFLTAADLWYAYQKPYIKSLPSNLNAKV